MTAIVDFVTLKAAILDETQRSGNAADVTRLPRFVQAAEQMITNGTTNANPVRVEDMERNADVVFTDGVGALPADYLEQVRLYWDGGFNLNLTYRVPRDFWEHRYINVAGAFPVIYTVEADTIRLSPAATGTGKLRYYANYAALSDDADTNWLLANSQVYFHAVCFQMFKHLRNDAKSSEHLASYVDAVNSLHLANERKRTGGRILAPRIPRSNVIC